MPLVSVIVPVFNAEAYIAQTIQSVLAQSFSDWELILVDDCSSDSSCDVIKPYLEHEQIKLLSTPKNSGGPATPRNIGFKAAQGDYLAFLDADDLWEPQKLERQLDFMRTHNLTLSSTASIDIDAAGRLLPRPYLRRLTERIKRKDLTGLIQTNFIALSSVMVEKKIMTSFNTDTAYIAVEDYCKWLELFATKTCRYAYLEHPLLRYRILEGSISERSQKEKQEIKALKCAVDFIASNQRYDLFLPLYRSISLRYLLRLFALK